MKQIPESGPRLPAIVHRKRLHRRLDRLVAPGIVVVSAQAAQGKTTLIADYLKARGGRSRWMALGPEDADPAYFGRHLVKVCQPYSGNGLTTPEKQTPPPDTAVIAKLFRRLPPDLSLVFDGWHRTGPAAQAVRRINAFKPRPAAFLKKKSTAASQNRCRLFWPAAPCSIRFRRT